MTTVPPPSAFNFSTLLVPGNTGQDEKVILPNEEEELSQKYQKKTQYEHIIDLPDTYIGSIIAEQVEQHILANVSRTTSESEGATIVTESREMITKAKIDYVPGLFKIFDEIIVNANDSRNRIDAKIANGEKGHTKMTTLKVNIFKQAGCIPGAPADERWSISVYNDGDGIDVAKHPVEQIWIPQMIFAELLTSGNYNKAEQKVTGGKNGYGAKLTNIFSTYFKIVTVDKHRKLKYSQIYRSNMTIKEEPTIEKYTGTPFTEITFVPDYPKFGMLDLTDDMIALFKKRTYDMAFTSQNNLTVWFNNTLLELTSCLNYIKLYLPDPENTELAYTIPHARWYVSACMSPNFQFNQISFVNGICTSRGGRHVDYVTKQITSKLASWILKKKKVEVRESFIKDNLMVFINSLIVNPSFDSQTKETLTTNMKDFGSKFELDDKFIEDLAESGIVDRALAQNQFQESQILKKTDGKKTRRILDIEKLDDAIDAGTKNSSRCTLILTEGDSAKATAVTGIGAIENGRQFYGIFPLRGKLLNTRDVKEIDLVNNKEITNIKRILGLQEGEDYKDTNKLRYGKIMILTDQDSVAGDTPLLLKDGAGNLVIETIERLSTSWTPNLNGKDYASTDYQVWTESGWTPIIHVMRHKVEKRMFRVLTHTGCVDVTEDHSLLNDKGEEITPVNCQVGNKLLHAFPEEFPISEPDNLDELLVTAGLLGTTLAKYCYLNIKPIDRLDLSVILNGPVSVKEAFIRAFNPASNMQLIMPSKKYYLQCIYVIYKSLGYEVTLDAGDDLLGEGYIMNINQDLTQPHIPNPEDNKIINIIDLGTTEQYVYDLETGNHHFQAGIGQMIVHNTDGSHIKGLVINYISSHFPSLLKLDGFITSMLTPIVKVWRGSNKDKALSFYTMTEYNRWLEANDNGRKWHTKYYKGLGTSTPEEAKQYFKDFKQIIYHWDDASNEAIDMAFNKDRPDDRKAWLKAHDGRVLDLGQSRVTFTEFINKDLIQFSIADNIRSLPNIMDGLKPSLRKILYCCFKRNLTGEIKVAQLAGYVGEHGAYHHGENSLQGAIVNMAQNFPGTNNINLLVPEGQFGTRIQGGKDYAAPRYIFTYLSNIVPKIFKKADEPLLKYTNDDGEVVEPEHYAPVIPMLLVNGADGIGTGWSCKLPQFNPVDLVAYIRDKINNRPTSELVPWYRGFKGQIFKVGTNSWMTRGKYRVVDSKTVEITELPVGTWTQNYKTMLDKMVYGAGAVDDSATGKSGGSKAPVGKKSPNRSGLPPSSAITTVKRKKITTLVDDIDQIDLDTETKILKDYIPGGSEIEIKFTLIFEPKILNALLINSDSNGINDFERRFALTSRISCNKTMNFFGPDNKLLNLESIDQIMSIFYETRIQYYNARRKHMIAEAGNTLELISVKVRFILDIIAGNIKINNVLRAEIEAQLRANNFPVMLDGKLVKLADLANKTDAERTDANYSYLVNMAIYNLTKEKIEELIAERERIHTELEAFSAKTAGDIWLTDLDEFMDDYERFTKAYYKYYSMNEDDFKEGSKRTPKLDLSTFSFGLASPSKF